MRNDIDWNKTALLVIDMQKAFVEPGQPLCVAGAAATVPALIQTISYVRRQGGRIIWVRREYKADGSDMESFRRRQMAKRGTLDILAKGSYGAEPVNGLEGDPGDHVVIKKRFSGFFETDLARYLAQDHITTLFITGTQTPNCVRATAFDAVSCGCRTIVLENCVSSASDAVQKSNLNDMRAAGIEIWPSVREVTVSQIMQKMIAFSEGNIHDIDHFIRVWTYAKTIGELEELDVHTQFILEVSAITHDIACPLCRNKYGNTNGKHQEEEGAPMVREFLSDTGMEEKDIERIAYLVGHHHTYTGIDGWDYQILIEADYIANASENQYSSKHIVNFMNKIMKTAAGKDITKKIFCLTDTW